MRLLILNPPADDKPKKKPSIAVLVENPDDIENKAGVRSVTRVLKLALVYAAVNNESDDSQVHMDAWNAAKSVAQYWTAA